MPAHPDVALEALSAHWREAFDVAEHALAAARDQLSPAQLSEHANRLREERVSTARELARLAALHGNRDPFVALMVPRSQLKPLLGLPAGVVACVYTLDGVLIGSAEAHAAAWTETFDEFIHARIERTHGRFAPFNPRVDYVSYMHGRPRLEGVRTFLASRGIRLPEGAPGDPPGTETVHGLANRKNAALQRHLQEHGLTAFAGARRYLELAREVGLGAAVVSASANARSMLEGAGLAGLVDTIVDGNAMVAEGMEPKPAPDAILAACRELGIEPRLTAAFETREVGVAAARTAGIDFVVGVDRGAGADLLRQVGADVVVGDLADLLERRRDG